MSHKYHIHTVGKMADGDVNKLFNELQNEFETGEAVYKCGSLVINENDLPQLVDDGKGSIISGVNFPAASSLYIYFRRGKSGVNGYTDSDREPSPYFDEIIIHPQEGSTNREAAKVIDIARAEKIIRNYQNIRLPKKSQNAANEAFDLLQAEVAALAQIQRETISSNANRQAEWEEFTATKREEIELDAKSRSEQFDAEKKAHLEKIDKLQGELDAAKKAVDDRNHMHVRRELRQKITDDISEVISDGVNPPGTTRKNIEIVIFIIICALVAGAFTWQNFEAFTASATSTTDTTLMWFLALKGTIGAIATIGFLVYAMGWLRNNYLRDVSKAHELQRYGLDINRASWVIETIMEMTGKEGRVLPEKWIEGSCHGLFHADGADSSNVNSLEALGAIMNVAGKVEIGPEGPKFEINRNGAKKIASNIKS